MLFYLPLICSSLTYYELKKKFKACCDSLMLSNFNISPNQEEILLDKMRLIATTSPTNSELYANLVSECTKIYSSRKIYYDTILFFKACFYIGQANKIDLCRILEEETTLEYLKIVLNTESEIFSDMCNYLNQPLSNNYVYNGTFRANAIGVFIKTANEKIKAIWDLKKYFMSNLAKVKLDESNRTVKITLGEEERKLLDLLYETLKDIKQIDTKLEDIKQKIQTLTLDKGDALFNEFVGLSKQKERLCSNVKHDENKYFEILELESEVKYKEFKNLRDKLDQKCTDVGKMFENWSNSLPPDILYPFDLQLVDGIKKFTVEAKEFLQEISLLEAEIKEIPVDISKYSFIQRFIYILMGNYEQGRRKILEIEDDFLIQKHNLYETIDEYLEFKRAIKKISELHKTMLAKRFVEKCEPAMSELITAGIVEMKGDIPTIKTNTMFEKRLDSFFTQYDSLCKTMKKERRVYVFVIGSIIIVLLILIFATVRFLTRD